MRGKQGEPTKLSSGRSRSRGSRTEEKEAALAEGSSGGRCEETAHPEAPLDGGFYPPVPQFFKEAPDMPEGDNFYVVQHGARRTEIPAWKSVLTEEQIRQVVTLLSHIKEPPPAAAQQ